MKTADSGWCAPPPSWPCIVSQQGIPMLLRDVGSHRITISITTTTKGTTMNLPQFWDMEEINYGANMSEDEFIHFFS